MKIKFSRILTSSMLAYALLLTFPSLAQEGTFPYELQDANNQELNLSDEDKTLIFEQEVKPVKNAPAESLQNASSVPAKSKNSASNKPVVNNTNVKGKDDALSFNFLYYIIQKYKASDIVGE
ncbi:MAG: hypothetical protein JJE09_06965 [Bacteroidia bacterium]|nr:hypothetical protein [Bacteroidia bacterium]